MSNSKIWPKLPKFQTKIALFGYFRHRILKNYSHILNQHAQIYWIAKFCEKIKLTKLGNNNVLFGSFWDRILRKDSHIWNQHPQIYQIEKIRQKTKIPKIGTNNASFGYFRAKIFKGFGLFKVSTLILVKFQNLIKVAQISDQNCLIS